MEPEDFRLDMPTIGVLVPADGNLWIPRDHEHDWSGDYHSYYVSLPDGSGEKKIRERACAVCGAKWLHY